MIKVKKRYQLIIAFFMMLTIVFTCSFNALGSQETSYKDSEDDDVIKSPFVRNTSHKEKNGKTYLKMDEGAFRELKRKIKNKKLKSISDFPLYEDKGVTITNIRELETCVGQTVVYHGNKQIHRKPDIVAITGEIEGSGESVFLSLSPRGAYGFTKDINGDPGRSLKYSPNSEYTIVSDTEVQDLPDLKQINDIVKLPDDQGAVSTNSIRSSTAKGLSQMSYYRIAVDTSANFLDEFDGDTEAAEDYIYSIFNNINPAYNEFNAHLYVNYIRLWPDGEGYFSTSISGLLSEFRRRWSNMDNPEYLIPRHVGIILTKNSEGNLAGLAGIDVVCGGFAIATINYGVQYTYITVAHELGHTFGSGHNGDYDPPIEACSIMGPCGNDTELKFHPRVIETFNRYRSIENDSCVPLTHPDETQGSCEEALAVQVSDVTYNSVSLSWNDNGGNSYDIYYKGPRSNIYHTRAKGVRATDYTMSNLDTNATYEIKVFSNCPDGSKLSDLVTATTIDDGVHCAAPNISVTSVTDSSVSFSWNDARAEKYYVQYRKTDTLAWQPTGDYLTKISYTLSGLKEGTAYDIQVLSFCPNGSYTYNIIEAATSGETQDSL